MRAVLVLVAACLASCGDTESVRDAWVVADDSGMCYAKIVADTEPGVDTVTVMRCDLQGDEVLWRVDVPSGGETLVAIDDGCNLIRVDADAQGDEPAVSVYQDGGLVGVYPRSGLARRGVDGRFTATVDPYHRGETVLHVVAVESGAECRLDLRGGFRLPAPRTPR